jgi:Domain of unknown function (DUF5703)
MLLSQFAGFLTLLSPITAAPPALDQYDVAWPTPSKDAAGSMPIGNGEVVLNVWAEEATGDLRFYIARTDSLSEISRVLKVGGVRIHVEPPLTGAFEQHLHLRDGYIEITRANGRMRLLVDSGANVIHIKGTFTTPHTFTVSADNWRNTERPLPADENGSAWSVHDAPFPRVESADVVIPTKSPTVTWYHRNETSVVPQLLENQSLTGLPGTTDPLLHRTFGAQIAGTDLIKKSDTTLESAKPTRSITLSIATHTAQTETVEEWQTGLAKVAASSKFETAQARTKAWWNAFWNRSWVLTSDEAVTQAYVLQRYVQACQGRGKFPIKFNGGYFTVEPTVMGRKSNPDFRNWGDSHWFQNVRHMYHPMLASGDIDLMDPFFRLYESNRELAEARTQKYHKATGAYFPETMSVFGTYSGGDYGWDRKGLEPKDVQCPWWQYAWNQGPELVALMLDRYDYTGDTAFLKKRVLPMAESVLRFFDTRFAKDDKGKVFVKPTQVVETYWEGVVNDMPVVAGLRAITDRLTRLSPALVPKPQREFFAQMKAACPELPLKTVNSTRELAPAQKYVDKTSNVENGELYAVWPFNLVSLNHPTLLPEGKTAYANRKNHLDTGWGYDGNVAALLGMTDEAARILDIKVHNSKPGYRWPATWGPNFDWLPDQNHGGNLLMTTQLMLLQAEPLSAGGAIRLLPAWPKQWDVQFRLHAPGNTVIDCVYRGGKIEQLSVSPPERLKDVIRPKGQS